MMVDAGYTFKKEIPEEETSRSNQPKRDGSHLSNLSAFANSELGLQYQAGKSIHGTQNPFNGSNNMQSVASVPIDLSMIDQESEMPVYSTER